MDRTLTLNHTESSTRMGSELIPVTVIMPVKNEACHVSRCLQALGEFSEVIVVDSQSSDETAGIAAKHGARVVQFLSLIHI